VLAASTASIFIRFAQQHAHSLVIAAYRLTLASLILAPFLLARERAALRQLKREDMARLLGSGLLLAIHFATWITSLAFTSVASSVVLVSMAPLFVAVLSPMLLRESPTREIKIGLVLALAGTVMVGLGDACTTASGLACPPLDQFVRGQALQGDLLALGGALAGAGYMIIGRRVRGHIALLPYIGVVYSMAAVTLVAIAASFGLPFFGYSPAAYGWFLLLALIPQLIAHSSINWALRYLTAAFVSITLLGEPLASSLWAYLLLDELPSALTMAGGVMILGGILIASRRPAPHEAAAVAEPGREA
jgi:drug/metabolite transporter (DMT)-like permease